MKKQIRFWILFFTLLFCFAIPAQAAFSDVRNTDWFAADISTMTEAGVLSGYPDGTFRPNDTITAAQFVSIVARYGGVYSFLTQDGQFFLRLSL